MKNFTLFSKIISPIILVGLILSYIGYQYLNTIIVDTIQKEVVDKHNYGSDDKNEFIIQIDRKDFETILHQNQMVFLNIIYMLLAILIVLVVVLIKIYIKNPIDVLLEHFKSIAQGKYEPIESRYNTKEIDLLIDDVNFMTKSIEAREEESKTLLALTQQNQAYIEDIISSQRNMIIISDENEILDVNDSFLKFFHEYKTLEEFKYQHEGVCDYFVKEEGFIYKFDDENWVEYILEHSKVLHKVKIYKDDQYHIYTIQAKKSDKYSRVIITMTDITELKQSNALLEQYKKAVDAGAIVSKADRKGVITYINDKFIKISGYTKEELIGQNQNIVRSKNSPSSLFKDMWQTIQNKKIWYGDIENRKKDGTPYFVSVTLIPILDENNNIYEYIALRYDIT
ncbi:MAG: PAS domain-containing protein, partial [Arcobacteraceae bacterium]